MEIVKYIIFGLGTTFINIISFTLLEYVGLDFKLANIVAWILSVTFAFYTNKKYVFDSKDNDINIIKKESLKFVSARLGSLAIDMVLMILLIDFMNINKMISKILVNIIIVIINYVVSKFYIFKKKIE